MKNDYSDASGRELTRLIIDEIKSELVTQGISMNELARKTGMTRKRIGRIFKSTHIRDNEARALSNVIKLHWTPEVTEKIDG